MSKVKTLRGLVIVIPTYGRVDRQITLRELPRELHQYTMLAAPEAEWADLAPQLQDGCGIIVQPPHVKKIHQKRQWIMKWAWVNGVRKVLMLDDDMFWQARGPKGLIKEYATDEWIVSAMEEMSDILTDYGHAGFSSRMGNNRVETSYAFDTRMMHSLGYNVEAFVAANARFDRVHGKEDFDVTLQMMSKGYPNVVVYHTCVSPGSYSAPGGCSLERTLESANAAAQLLKQYHPKFVRLVEKDYKNHPRLEVQMAWKKALEAGTAKAGNVYACKGRPQTAEKLRARYHEEKRKLGAVK